MPLWAAPCASCSSLSSPFPPSQRPVLASLGRLLVSVDISHHNRTSTHSPPGSSAAAWQAAIGSVAAGSAFATLQSVAMTAAIPALWYIVPGAVGVGIGALIGWLTGGRNRPAAGATAAAPGGDGGDSWMMDAIRAVRRRVHHLRWASYRLSLWLSPRGGYTRCRGDDGGERGQDGERGRGRGQGFVGWVHGVARRAWDFFSWLRPRW